jgi:hypothetical protein
VEDFIRCFALKPANTPHLEKAQKRLTCELKQLKLQKLIHLECLKDPSNHTLIQAYYDKMMELLYEDLELSAVELSEGLLGEGEYIEYINKSKRKRDFIEFLIQSTKDAEMENRQNIAEFRQKFPDLSYLSDDKILDLIQQCISMEEDSDDEEREVIEVNGRIYSI